MLLTFDKIREMYFKEKESQKLQELPQGFFLDASEYMKGNDETVKSSINDLIDNRKKKIANMALMSLKSEITAKPVNMTREEETLFFELIDSLKKFNSIILGSKITAPHSQNEDFHENQSIVEQKNLVVEHEKLVAKNENSNEENDGFVTVKESIPTFMGPDMKTYCLKKGDKTYIPKELRDFLVQKGICERLN